jgi:TolB-like protein
MRLYLALAFMAILATASFAAGPYAVLPFVPTGVDSLTARVASGLLISELRSQGATVIDKRDLTPTESPQDAAKLLTDSGAELGIYGSLLQLGSKIIVEVNVVKVATAELVFTDRLTAESADDLDTVIRRLAAGIVSGKKAGATATVETVTAEEEKTPRRRATFSSAGLRAGYMWPTSDSWGGVTKMVAVDFVYGYETAKWQLEVVPFLGFRTGSTNGNDAFDWAIFDFNFHYFLTQTDISPYLGGGLGFHSVHAQERVLRTSHYDGNSYDYYEDVKDDGTGFAFNAGGGIVFFRTYDFHLTADLRYQYVTYTFKKLEHNQTQSVMFTIGFAYARGHRR